MIENWDFITRPVTSFAGVPVCTHLNEVEADIALLGLHYVSPYPSGPTRKTLPPEAETAADAIRRRSAAFAGYFDHFDFNLNRVLLADRRIRIVDCGDVQEPAGRGGRDHRRITAAIGALLGRGALPIAFGDDEGGFIHAIRAYEAYDNICVVHIDAHIDWRDERHGVREGYSSVMRRTSEMPWVTGMAQIGLRGVGSARQQEVDDARAFGSVFIRARDIRKEGVAACLGKIPASDNYVVTIDSDVFETAIAPGVLFSSPGGLSFFETIDILEGIAQKGRIVGMNLFEVRPELDVNDVTASTAAQLILHFIGAMAGTDQIGP